jgi:hypothetical protein
MAAGEVLKIGDAVQAAPAEADANRAPAGSVEGLQVAGGNTQEAGRLGAAQ